MVARSAAVAWARVEPSGTRLPAPDAPGVIEVEAPLKSGARLRLGVARGEVGVGAAPLAGLGLGWLLFAGAVVLRFRRRADRARPEQPVEPKPEVACDQRLALMARALHGSLEEAAHEVARRAADGGTQRVEEQVSGAAYRVEQVAGLVSQAALLSERLASLARGSTASSSQGQKAVTASIEAVRGLQQRVEEITRAMAEFIERTKAIAEIVENVRELSERSNILALNAALEAAAAGEHGRGISVVAIEMRSLAEQSRAATLSVRKHLLEIHRSTRAAVAALEGGRLAAAETITHAETAGSAIEKLSASVGEVAETALQLDSSTREQAGDIEQLVAALTELSSTLAEAAAETAGLARIETMLQELAGQAEQLARRLDVPLQAPAETEKSAAS
ncbi:MAG: methyl-accepting chemotaxis protein [Myxococcales bacterium]